MQEEGIRGASRRPFRPAATTAGWHHRYRSEPAQARLANRSGKVYAGDITYMATYEGWLNLTVVLDMLDRRLFGWQLADLARKRRHDQGRGLAAPRPRSLLQQ